MQPSTYCIIFLHFLLHMYNSKKLGDRPNEWLGWCSAAVQVLLPQLVGALLHHEQRARAGLGSLCADGHLE